MRWRSRLKDFILKRPEKRSSVIWTASARARWRLLSRIVKVLLHLNLRIRRHKVVSAVLLNTMPGIENQSNRCVFQTALCFIQSVNLPNRPRTAFFAKLIAHPTQFSRSVIRATRPFGPSSLCRTHIFLAVFTPFIERLLHWFGIRSPTCA